MADPVSSRKPEIPDPMPKSSSMKEKPVLGPYDFWCQLDKVSGFFAVTDHHGNRQWTGGTADVPLDTTIGRYDGTKADALGIEFHDQPRWNYYLENVAGQDESRNAKLILDIVERKSEGKEAE